MHALLRITQSKIGHNLMKVILGPMEKKTKAMFCLHEKISQWKQPNARSGYGMMMFFELT